VYLRVARLCRCAMVDSVDHTESLGKMIYAITAFLIGLGLQPPAQQPAPAAGCCASVYQACCRSACAARSGPRWYQADSILRGCLETAGCDTHNPTTNLECPCQK
jgi:hypothetical protein